MVAVIAVGKLGADAGVVFTAGTDDGGGGTTGVGSGRMRLASRFGAVTSTGVGVVELRPDGGEVLGEGDVGADAGVVGVAVAVGGGAADGDCMGCVIQWRKERIEERMSSKHV